MFIDGMQFMNSILDKLVQNFSDEGFKYLVEEFSFENFELLKQKGAYPYEHINSFERFNEKKLPAKKYFCSSSKDGKICDDFKRSDGHISFKDYLMCRKIWNKFGWLSRSLFEKRRIVISRCFCKVYWYVLKILWVDPCDYFSSPELSWNTMLKMTGVTLEKISDIDMYLFIQKGIKRRSFLHS